MSGLWIRLEILKLLCTQVQFNATTNIPMSFRGKTLTVLNVTNYCNPLNLCGNEMIPFKINSVYKNTLNFVLSTTLKTDKNLVAKRIHETIYRVLYRGINIMK